MTRGLFLVGAGVGLVLVIGAAIVARRALPGAAGALGDAINPLNNDNVFSQAANAVTGAITGVPDDSLGVAFWRLLNPTQSALDEAINSPVVITGGPATVSEGGAVDMGAGFGNGDLFSILERARPRFAETPGGAVTGIFGRR